MQLALFAALLVGGATMLGVAAGFLFKRASVACSLFTLSAAAGVMLASAVVGLLLPAMELGKRFGLFFLFGGVLCAAVCMALTERLLARPNVCAASKEGENTLEAQRVLLFAAVIAIHNLPEGLAAGVAFGAGDQARAWAVTVGIALQNLPEGMATVTPMLAASFLPTRTLLFGLFTGAVEIFGTLLGYCSVRLCAPLLPFALAFAGGCMLYVIFHDMIFEGGTKESGRSATFAFLGGFCLMLAMDYLLG